MATPKKSPATVELGHSASANHDTVTVGCKLPNGIIIEMGDIKVEIKGALKALVIGGHGITENVNKEFFEAWMAKNKGLKFVQEGFIFACKTTAEAGDQAKDRQDEKTGLEPLPQDKLPEGIEAATEE